MPVSAETIAVLTEAGVTGVTLVKVIEALDRDIERYANTVTRVTNGYANSVTAVTPTVTRAALRMRKMRAKRKEKVGDPLREQTVTSDALRDIDIKKESNCIEKEGKKKERKTLPQKRNAVTPAYPPEFEELWQCFGRKVGKDAAVKAWLKVRGRVEHETLKQAIEAQARIDADKERRFIAHPATWLNEGRWQDEELQEASHGRLNPKLSAEQEAEYKRILGWH